ncbi:MAG: flagellar FliJ family protein [Phycisphaeraceae bacterium]|nr:flagellar FliJ family protein [Phycisphaeraceae bacterium]
MARFRFELEHVLDLRKRQERDAQIAFSAIDRERAALESQIRGYQRTIVGFKRDLRVALAGERAGDGEPGAPVTLHDVRSQAGASLMVMGKAQAAVIQLAAVHKRLDAAREALLEAARARKAVEMLRERRYEQWKRAMNRREAAELDDLATMRAGREEFPGAAR